ncbi:MAG: Rpn family recombination-promoting nuclease/putative transposase [Deltaproteobacteria bacterium]|jgi:predicted transposase/invertase (TIGR01784 family)|nr:Rpn family recombination-promoting nuclease/putative transposase [Deltaproteobacteria bacterium]
MELKPLSATNDFVFRKIFGENLYVLKDFLEAVLDLPAEEYKNLTVVDPNLEREYIEDKLGILDVKVTTGSGKVVDIEVQVRQQRAIWKRMLFYTSKMLVEQVKSGYPYDRMNRAISILIADFVMIQENNAYRHCFRLYDRHTQVRYPDFMEINVLELPKMRTPDGTRLGNWMSFFKATTEEEYMDAAQTNPAINEAWGVIKVLSGDERNRALAEAREKSRMDFESFLGDARYEGWQEGLQEGRQEEKLEVARNLLQKKMPHDDISDATGLPLDEIKRLAADLA